VNDTESDMERLNITWEFGDGAVAYGRVVEHAYALSGIYMARVKVRDTEYCSVAWMRVEVNESMPVFDCSIPPILAEDEMGRFVCSWDGDVVWRFGDGCIASGSIVEHQYARAGVYQGECIVRNAYGVKAVRPFNVTVVNTPPEVRIEGELNITEYDTLVLHAVLRDSALDLAHMNITWAFGDGAMGYGVTVAHRYATPGTYNLSVAVRDEEYCVEQHAVVRVENVEPWVYAHAKRVVAEGKRCEFTAEWFDFEGVEMEWWFGDGTMAYGATVEHVYARSGCYNAMLRGYDVWRIQFHGVCVQYTS